MRHTKIPLENTKSFSHFFLDYIQKKDTLRPFYDAYPTPENFNNLLTKKSGAYPSRNRAVLKTTLEQQYTALKTDDRVKANIHALGEPKTFTVTTGHQLNIFTGPLYFIYKIITVINTCKELAQRFPDYTFVPVYWMASEDHDYDEIKYFRLYGKKYIWETSQKGAVGRFETKGMEQLLNNIPGDTQLFRDAYLKHKKLSDAVRYYVNALFGPEGVVVIDPDDHVLKGLFSHVIREDVTQNTTVRILEKTDARLKASGYDPQIFCRDINFFFLGDQQRNRIEKQGQCYHIVDTAQSFNEDQTLRMIDEQPGNFSPNVVLRPLYQEMILPNIAYVGGPAEVVYWLQLKDVFDHYQTPFPAVMPRNFAMVIDQTVDRKLRKTGLDADVFFEEKNFIFNHWVLQNTKHNLTIGTERTMVISVYEDLKSRAESIDKTLGPFVGAEGKRAINSLEKIEKKMLRAEKRLHQDRLRQIEEVKDALFPNGSLQERTDNFLNFYNQDNGFIQKLISHFDPFDFRFNILTYQDS